MEKKQPEIETALFHHPVSRSQVEPNKLDAVYDLYGVPNMLVIHLAKYLPGKPKSFCGAQDSQKLSSDTSFSRGSTFGGSLTLAVGCEECFAIMDKNGWKIRPLDSYFWCSDGLHDLHLGRVSDADIEVYVCTKGLCQYYQREPLNWVVG